jgi:SAM-dependent methyltransferase
MNLGLQGSGAGARASFPLNRDSSESLAREFYDEWIGEPGFLSAVGRLVFSLSGLVYCEAFVRAAALSSHDKVLEIGCGFGTILREAQTRIGAWQAYVGIDISYQMISRAHKDTKKTGKGEQIQFAVGNAVNLPFRASQFDVILLSHVIKYLTDEQFIQVLAEAKRVLRPHGRIVIWEFGPYVSSSVTQRIVRSCNAQKLRDATEVRKTLQGCGYADLKFFRLRTPWLPWRNVAFAGKAIR